MKHSYNITGMTCTSCKAKVQQILLNIEGVSEVAIDLTNGDTDITMSKQIDVSAIKNALANTKYQLIEKEIEKQKYVNKVIEEEHASWLETYKPILLVFGFILGITFFIQIKNESFLWMQWMNHFMAGFFLVFSFFKFLNLSGFAESYAMYDIVAKRWHGYGYVYAFMELLLGLAYITAFNPLITNIATLIIMSVSIIGVLQSVLENKKIKCACLGAVFNLPMSTITIIEDALMIGMSGFMLLHTF